MVVFMKTERFVLKKSIMAIDHSFIRYVIVGSFGFLIDYSIFILLFKFGAPFYFARIISVFVATSSTWLLNRMWTFVGKKRSMIKKEYIQYFAVYIISNLINFSIFVGLIYGFPFLKSFTFIAFGISCGCSVLFTYFVLKYFVFTGDSKLT